MRTGFKDALAAVGAKGVVTGFGSMFHVHFTDGTVHDYRDTLQGNRRALYDVHMGMLRRGVFINPGA